MTCEKCGKEFFEDWRKDKQTIKKELDKTILLCSNCHREVENSFTLLEDL